MSVLPRMIRDPAGFWGLAEEWRRLMARLGTSCPFLSPEWVGIGFDFFGEPRENMLITFREEGELVGVVPLAVSRRKKEVRVSFAVDPVMTDYADVLVEPRARTQVFEQLPSILLGENPGGEVVVSLEPIRADSPTLLAMEKALSGKGFRVATRKAQASWVLALPGSAEEYLYRVLKAGDRNSMIKKEDRLSRLHSPEIEAISGPLELAENLDDLLWMYVSESPEKREFMGPEREAFLREVMPIMAKRGQAVLFYLRAGQERVAGHLCLMGGDTLYTYISAESGRLGEFSPGLLLAKAIVEWAIESGLKMVDFLRGNDEWAKLLGAKPLDVYQLAASNRVPLRIATATKPRTRLVF